MTRTSEKLIYHNSFFAMNTRFEAILWGCEQKVCMEAFQLINTAVCAFEKAISFYAADSELFLLNQKAYENPVSMSSELSKSISIGMAAYYLTNGYFDISKGNAYHNLKEGKSPKNIIGTDIRNRIIINKEHQTVRFSNPDVTIDFGGMGKGMALKMVADIIDQQLVPNAFISFGESSILTRGRHPHGDYWPFALDKSLANEKEWQLNNSTISVSSTLTRHLGKVHIFDPLANKGVSHQKTVLVQAPNPIDAEILSTALIAAPDFAYESILGNYKVEDVTIINL
ncbi:MAG TPA: FAD:protein FMN transferase [Prolixibacteraceae bacterium]|nr:FAD:protein FMN transferase [Prolixibacteraceae bacterium]